MVENSNLIAEGQKKLLKYRNSKFAGEFKTRAMAETTSLSSTTLFELNYRHRAQA